MKIKTDKNSKTLTTINIVGLCGSLTIKTEKPPMLEQELKTKVREILLKAAVS